MDLVSSNAGQPFPTMAGTRMAMHHRESRGFLIRQTIHFIGR
jgi:hypothetical protein